jgi:NADH-quinone oxidoreductase subunit G
MSVKVIIDGKEYQVEEGARLIDVCREKGIDIPHFCYHPGLGHDGNCRMCQVEFVTERGSRLGISCNAFVTDGMEVLTQSKAALDARASVEEMLLLNHPLDCPICDKSGECTLQNYYMAHDLQDSRMDFTRFRKEKAKDIGPTMVLDQQRCVLCDRCVRFLRDIAGDEQLYIAGRGHGAYITTFPGKEVTSPYSLNTVDLCPVGALTAKDFRFASPTWFLDSTPSVCTTCARGCSMEIQSKKDKIHRMRPRHNPDVNGYWMCDEGRLNYKFVNDNRYNRPFVRRDGETLEVSFEEAIAEMRETVRSASKSSSLVLVSATCTIEEMFAARRLARDVLDVPVFAVRHVPDGVEDDLLRKADKHPNTKGAELLGLDVLDLTGGGSYDRVEAALGEDGVLVCVGFNYAVPAGIETLMTRAGKVIAVSGCVTTLGDGADLVVPGVTFAEKDGLVVNFDGHIQRLRVAIDHAPTFAPMAQTVRNTPLPRSDWVVLDSLVASLQGVPETSSIAELRKAIGESEAAFACVDLNNIGAMGVRLAGQAVTG